MILLVLINTGLAMWFLQLPDYDLKSALTQRKIEKLKSLH